MRYLNIKTVNICNWVSPSKEDCACRYQTGKYFGFIGMDLRLCVGSG
jgi:hypothetical protein